MGFDISNNIQSNGITKEQFVKSIKKDALKQKAESIFNQFNQNLATNTNGQQVLDKAEQANLMAFFKRIAGTNTDDTSINRKDVKNAKKDGVLNNNISYGDIKNISKSYIEAINSNGIQDDSQITFGDNNQIIATSGDTITEFNIDENLQLTSSSTTENGTVTNSTTYNYNNSALSSIISTDTTEDGSITTTNDNSGNTNIKVTQNGSETITEDFQNKQKTVENTEKGITTITKYSDNQLTQLVQTITINKNENKVTVEEQDANGNTVTSEYTGNNENSVSDSNLAKKTIQNSQNNSTIVNEYSNGKLTTSTESLSDKTIVTNYDESGNKTVITENTKDGKTITTDLVKHTKVTTGETPNVTKTEVLNQDNSEAIRTLSYDNSKHSAIINNTTFKTDNDGNIISYALYNGKYETLTEAATRLGLEEGSEAYNTFIQQNGGKAHSALRAGQKLKIPQSIVADSTVKFNIEGAKVDRQTQINNWRVANPEKAAQSAAQRQGLNDLRQTFATKDYQIYYSPTGEKKSNVVGQGATGGTHYIYQNGKLVNLETKFNLQEGEHIIRVTDDGTVRTNKNRYLKLNGAVSSASDYNNSFKRSHAATGGKIKDIKGNTIGQTKISIEQGTPEEIARRNQQKELQNLSNDYKNALQSFNEQLKKDGWAANTADFVSKAWGWAQEHANNADAVRADFATYRTNLAELRTAIQQGNTDRANELINELKSMDIVNRVANYNKSQDDGAAAVKTTVVVTASVAAGIATGGSSLLVEAAVVGGATAGARFLTETTDLASNDIDGDVQANLGNIAEQSLVEGTIAAGTAGLFRGGSSLLSKSATTTEQGLVRATSKQGIVKSTSNTSSTVTERGLVRGTNSTTRNATSNSTGQAGNTASRTTSQAAGNSASSGLETTKTFLNSIKGKFSSTSGASNLSAAEREQLANTLGISTDELGSLSSKNIYRKLFIKFHPDKNPGNETLATEISQIVQEIQSCCV